MGSELQSLSEKESCSGSVASDEQMEWASVLLVRGSEVEAKLRRQLLGQGSRGCTTHGAGGTARIADDRRYTAVSILNRGRRCAGPLTAVSNRAVHRGGVWRRRHRGRYLIGCRPRRCPQTAGSRTGVRLWRQEGCNALIGRAV